MARRRGGESFLHRDLSVNGVIRANPFLSNKSSRTIARMVGGPIRGAFEHG